MLKWIGIALAILVVLAVEANVRAAHRRRRVATFLRAHGVDFVRIKMIYSYGWPSYVVIFDSVEKTVDFRKSAAFHSLVQEVQKMHGHGDTRFDATRAVYANADIETRRDSA